MNNSRKDFLDRWGLGFFFFILMGNVKTWIELVKI